MPGTSGRLRDKVCVIAGAGGRQGSVVPVIFAREGARLVLAGLDGDGVQALAARIAGTGGQCVAIAADLTDEAGSAAAIRLALDTYGRIDVLYNNTGIYTSWEQRAHETDAAAWRTLLAVNAESHFLTAKAALAAMIGQQSGCIINVAAARPARLGGNVAYAASKGAVIAMTKKMAREYAADNIRVNCICPTNIQASPDPLAGALPVATLSRDGTPEDVAYAALFLASDEAAWITGAEVTVDGGGEVAG